MEVEGQEGTTMADQMKEIDAAKTPTEELVKEVMQCICFNKKIDLEDPKVRYGLGAHPSARCRKLSLAYSALSAGALAFPSL